MGEYAKRADGVEVKIGTCENMYYLRYENRAQVSKLSNSLDPNTELNLRWRLPFPDEDHIKTGEYHEYNRGYELNGYSDPDNATDTGTMQLFKFGMLLNVRCYHGEKLPEDTKEINIHWNGKQAFYVLSMIKNTEEGIFPIIECKACRNMWRTTWDKVLPFVYDKELKERLEKYAQLKPEPQTKPEESTTLKMVD